MKESFAAYVVNKKDGRVEGEVTTLRADQLPVGDITIAVEYSSLNYKDGMILGGIGRCFLYHPGRRPGLDDDRLTS